MPSTRTRDSEIAKASSPSLVVVRAERGFGIYSCADCASFLGPVGERVRPAGVDAEPAPDYVGHQARRSAAQLRGRWVPPDV
jgi:hypothetical protein